MFLVDRFLLTDARRWSRATKAHLLIEDDFVDDIPSTREQRSDKLCSSFASAQLPRRSAAETTGSRAINRGTSIRLHGVRTPVAPAARQCSSSPRMLACGCEGVHRQIEGPPGGGLECSRGRPGAAVPDARISVRRSKSPGEPSAGRRSRGRRNPAPSSPRSRPRERPPGIRSPSAATVPD